MRDKKATGDGVPRERHKLLGDDDLKINTQLINNIYETGEWSKDFIEVIVIALKKPRATKWSNHHTYSQDSSEDT
jgi:hypothetical protein